jgi:hypothetical protein
VLLGEGVSVDCFEASDRAGAVTSARPLDATGLAGWEVTT